MIKPIFKKLFFSLIFFGYLFFSLFSSVNQVYAQEVDKLGIHLLQTYEIDQAKELFKNAKQDEKWHYVTIPFTLEDLTKKAEWQNFFTQAKKHKLIPVIRLATKFENNAWQIPNRKEIVNMVDFLADLDWPTTKKHLIIFNEVNHAKEWGGIIDPAGYALVFRFTASWAHSLNKNFIVMPAAMDLAAPNGKQTMDAFIYLEQMLVADPEIFYYPDLWNSHSYPNPGFSASPERTNRTSLRGFLHELDFIKNKTGREMQVMITETGWDLNGKTDRWLEQYYLYASQHIWNNDKVVAVTPFLLRGAPGPFAGFSMLDENNQPTKQYQAYVKAMQDG